MIDALELLTWVDSLSAVSRSCPSMQPEVPEMSQGTPTADGHAFGSMQGEGVRCGLGLVHRWSALKERQRALLERLAVGEEAGVSAAGEWCSAYALCDRDLLKVSKGAGDAHVEVTEAGWFYLRHGRHPDDPAFAGGSGLAVTAESRTPYSERPVARARRAKATKLIERLVPEGRVRFADADDDEVAEWRCVVNDARRRGAAAEVRSAADRDPRRVRGLNVRCALMTLCRRWKAWLRDEGSRNDRRAVVVGDLKDCLPTSRHGKVWGGWECRPAGRADEGPAVVDLSGLSGAEPEPAARGRGLVGCSRRREIHAFVYTSKRTCARWHGARQSGVSLDPS